MTARRRCGGDGTGSAGGPSAGCLRAGATAFEPACRRVRRALASAGVAIIAATLAQAPAAAAAQGHRAHPGPAAPDEPARAEDHRPLSPWAAESLRLLNARRAAGADCGSRHYAPAPPLRWNAALEHAAGLQAADIGRRGTVSHAGSDGSSVGQRVKREGYAWGLVGENAAAGHDSVAATVGQWMASPGHCANVMGPGFSDTAVAAVHVPGSTYRWYWIMVLARPLHAD